MKEKRKAQNFKEQELNIAELSQLFDLYGELLTDKKREVMQLYYEDDMSLAEIAEELGVSRAAVHDSLKSAEKLLRDYEEKLKILSDYQKRVNAIDQIKAELVNIKDNSDAVKRISRIIEKIDE